MTSTEPDSGRDDAAAFLLRSYADGGHLTFTAPSPDVIVHRARRRATTKMALSLAAVVAVAAGGVAAINAIQPDADRSPPIIGPPSPSETAPAPPPSPTPSATTSPPAPPPSSGSRSSSPKGTPTGTGSAVAPLSVRGVDWENTTITISASTGDTCLTGRIRFVDGIGGTPGDAPHIAIRSAYDDGAATFGDLNGDGRDEAVVWASCMAGAGDEDGSGQLLVVTGRSGRLVGSWVGTVAEVVDDIKITDERLTIASTKKYTENSVERTYRWTGTRYERA
ncbi:hypothetical protein V6V47_18470 [Micromonospora sp. CPCC 205539]|uniref:hypothetical protein n=1 Tax=Micromonospora sp. CPCC 205539 TaxID=3122408 RepID=UPI002FF18410